MQVTHHYQHYQHDHQHIAIRGVSTMVPPSGKKARRALGLVPSRIVDAFSSTSTSSSTKTTTGSSPSCRLLHLFHLSSSQFYLLHRFALPLILDPTLSLEESFCSSGYTARFISHPANWEARTAAGITERRFPSSKGMRYRERRRNAIVWCTGRNLWRTNQNRRPQKHPLRSSASPRFSITARWRDALSTACSGLVN